MPFSHSIPKRVGFVSRLHLTELSVFPGALTGRLRAVALVLACLLVGLAPYQLQAQALGFLNNYFVTGDHIVRDFQYSSTNPDGSINGTITILPRSKDAEGVPDGAEIVAAFLYWQVLQPMSPSSPDPGSFALFNGYSITGDKVIPPVGSEPGACGSQTAFVRSYRADVLPYLPVGANGTQAVGTHTVGLPPNPNGDSSRPGASLVIVYRVLSGAPWSPLKATVIYEGSLEAYGPQIFSLYVPIGGFYDAVFSNGSLMTNAKITDIWGAVSFDGTTARLLNFTSYTSAQAVDDHASTITDTNEYGVQAQQCAVFTTSVFTTRVYSGDGDGLLDAWKTNQGYCDFGVNPTCSGPGNPAWVDLTGATVGKKDIFVQVDYMYAVDHSHEPRGDALSMVTNAFLKQNINLHFGAGNFIPEDTCTDDLTQTPPLLCMFPNEPGVVAWKLGLEAFKAWPTNILNTDPPSCSGGVCTPRFQPGRKDSYHYLLIGHSLALPTWSVADPIYTLKSIQVSNGNATVTTSATLTSCPSRVTIDGAIATPNLNGVYTTITCPSTLNTTFTISSINVNKTPPYTVADGTYPNTLAEPYLAVYTSVTDSTSGYSDIGGGDIAVALGKWTWEEGRPAENEIGGECFISDIDVSPQCENGLAGTLMHELGHNLTLLHGGRFYPGNPASSTPEPSLNCKPNYQSVMNYLFQVDLLQSDAQGDRVLDYSSQALDPLDENNLSATPGITPALQYPYTKWFAPSPPFLTLINNPPPAPAYHCDGTPNSTNETAYEMEGLANPIAWSNGWDINFDGGLEVLDGYGNNDWSIIDPRQVGASGNDNVSGTICPPNQSQCNNASNAYLFGTYYFGSNGGIRAAGGGGIRAAGGGGIRAAGGGGIRAAGGGGIRAAGGGGIRAAGGGGVGEPNYPKIDSYPRPPRAVTASGGLVAWKPATFGNIVQYNVYRVNGLSSTLIACVYVGTPPVPSGSGCVQGGPYATSYSYSDNGAPADSTYSVTTVDLDPVSNLPRESTPQGSGAFQALLHLNVTTPLTYGSSETLTTTGGSTGGTVIFYLLSGPCSVSGTQLTAKSGTGSCSVAATMAGDSTYNPVTSAVLIISLQKANATITVTPYSVTYDGNAHTATGTATGVKGESLNGLNLSATTHTAAGVYNNDTWTFTDGTGNYNNDSGTVLDTITQSSTATTLSATPNPANFGQSVSLQATVTPIPPGTGTPTGTVTFKDGVTPLSTVTMSSAAASFVTSSLAPGTHNLTASYSGDANFSQSSSAVLAEQIVCGLLLSISPSTVKQGGTVTVAAKLISCSTSAQTVVMKFTLSGPLQPNSCSSKKTDIFTTPPFTLPPKTSKSISFPVPILKRTCPGTYTITATTLVNGTAVNTSTASLTITSQ